MAEIGPQQPYFHTLRGFLRNEESSEEIYFKFRAGLRIHGECLPIDEISNRLGVNPSHVHRKGERHGPNSPPHREDAWQFSPELNEADDLSKHINALWEVVRPHVEYIKSLKPRYHVDVFCGYRSNCDHAGIEVPHDCLILFTKLEIPFGLSIIVTE